MHDEILEAVVRDELRDQGLDDDSVDEALAAMRENGMFDVPDWTP
jgi:predicted GNAT family acetyltransferase